MADARVPMVLAALTAAIDGLLDADRSVLAEGDTVLALLAQVSRLELVTAHQAVAFEASPEWVDDGAYNGTSWVTAKRRCLRSAARRRLRLGAAMRHMPLVDAAWRRGLIDPDHVEVLVKARIPGLIDAFTRDEQLLVDIAIEQSHQSFTEAVAYWKQCNAPDDADKHAESQREQREVHLSQSFEGMWFGTVTYDPVAGEIVSTELRRIEQQLFETEWAETKERLGREPTVMDLPRTPAQRRADALVEMATRSNTAPVNGRRPTPLFTVLVDYETLAGRICELASRTVVTPGSLLPWLDEAYVERIVFDGKGRLIDVGVQQRLFRGGKRRGIQVRDRICAHPLCEEPVERCEIDHIEPYAQGGETSVDNGRLLCPFHNRLRNTRPWPEWPQPPQADNHAKTDPHFMNEASDDERPGDDPDAKTDQLLTSEPETDDHEANDDQEGDASAA
jgi:hypothetical protein